MVCEILLKKARWSYPRAAKDMPFINTQLFPQSLYVIHQIPGRVVYKRRERCRLSRTALIKEDDLVLRWIEKAAI